MSRSLDSRLKRLERHFALRGVEAKTQPTTTASELLAEVVNTISQDIEWHENSVDKVHSRDYQKGFINGLIQARYLVGEISRKLEEDD